MTKVRNPKLDGTWRLVTRDIYEPFTGQDCYLFQRAAEPGSHQLWLTWVVPVEEFWKGA